MATAFYSCSTNVFLLYSYQREIWIIVNYFWFLNSQLYAKMSYKRELQCEKKLVSYERAFKMLQNYVYHWNKATRSQVIRL